LWLAGPPERPEDGSRRLRRVAALGLAGAVSATPEGRSRGRARRERQAQPRGVEQKVRLSLEERRQLRERAADLGVSVPRLLVESALSGGETPTDRRAMIAELFEVRRLLATVANNVNQLAKVANTSGEVSVGERLARTLGEVDELVVELRAWTGARR
jgi:hypothetical protein